VIDRIGQLLRNETAGDPIHGLQWTRKTTRRVAQELRRVDIRISARTVGRLLKDMGFSLRVNQKNLESGNRNPPPRQVRNRQFKYINRKRKSFASAGNPIISVDTKKKEKVGNFKNPGVSWKQVPYSVNDHDFPNDAVGMAIPYGIYDTEEKHGFVAIGTSHETPSFAVESIAQWWKRYGRTDYPQADELLILADCGGGNSARSHAWKYHLQHKLCDPHGLKVTVCHYPPGASKWNPIEHHLFSHISHNWAGKPLESYETVLKYIKTTQTTTGLAVKASLITKNFDTGEKISAADMASLSINMHKTLPNWNYTLEPSGM
jgi:hypothetical protein